MRIGLTWLIGTQLLGFGVAQNIGRFVYTSEDYGMDIVVHEGSPLKATFTFSGPEQRTIVSKQFPLIKITDTSYAAGLSYADLHDMLAKIHASLPSINVRHGDLFAWRYYGSDSLITQVQGPISQAS